MTALTSADEIAGWLADLPGEWTVTTPYRSAPMTFVVNWLRDGDKEHHRRSGSFTADFRARRRGTGVGLLTSRDPGGASEYSGRGWQRRLVRDAAAALMETWR